MINNGFLPKNYIGSGALSKSPITVSSRDTGFIPEDRKNYESVKTLIPT